MHHSIRERKREGEREGGRGESGYWGQGSDLHTHMTLLKEESDVIPLLGFHDEGPRNLQGKSVDFNQEDAPHRWA